jgi:hypothetical protein
MTKTTLALFAAATLVFGFAAPAGTTKPSVIRHVYIDGISGPAYYSVVDGGYRSIRSPSALARVADITDTARTN